jgi:release factor glutamine methyltransferase
MRIADVFGNRRIAFMGLEFLVAPRTPLPRKETELLARTALEAIRASGIGKPRVIDMCCGSGNIACGIARHLPDAEVWACDITDRCIELAWSNVRRLGLLGRVRVRQGDLFASLGGMALENSVDAIVCNPPYIPSRRMERDRAYLLKYEPREAFDGGPYGISLHQRVVREGLCFLRPGGLLMVEVGLGQGHMIAKLVERAQGYEGVRLINDVWGQARVVLARKKTVLKVL